MGRGGRGWRGEDERVTCATTGVRDGFARAVDCTAYGGAGGCDTGFEGVGYGFHCFNKCCLLEMR